MHILEIPPLVPITDDNLKRFGLPSRSKLYELRARGQIELHTDAAGRRVLLASTVKRFVEGAALVTDGVLHDKTAATDASLKARGLQRRQH